MPKDQVVFESSSSEDDDTVGDPNYEPPARVGTSTSGTSTSIIPIPDYVEATDDDQGCDDNFSFPTWTVEPLPMEFIPGTHQMNEFLILSSQHSRTLGRVTWVFVPEVPFDRNVS